MSRSKHKEYLSSLHNGKLATAHQSMDLRNFHSSYIIIIIIITIIAIVVVIIIVQMWRVQRTGHLGTHKITACQLPRMRQLEE
jgi:uncharacterized membrane protein